MRVFSACLLLVTILGFCGPLDHANAQRDFMITDPEPTVATEVKNFVGEVAEDSIASSKSNLFGETVEPAQTQVDFDQPAEFQTEVSLEEIQTDGYLEGTASAEQWPAETLAAQTLPTTALTQDLSRTISIAGGANWLDEVSGYVISAAIGKRLSNRLRFDFEFAHRSNKEELDVQLFHSDFSRVTSKPKIDANSLLVNLFSEWNNATRLTPYAGAGLGVSFVRFEDQATVYGGGGQALEQIRIGDNDTVFAWQAIGGVSYHVATQSDLFVEYRYFATSDVFFDRLGPVGNYNTHNLMLGFRKKF